MDQALGALRDATEGRVLERPADAGAPAVVLTPPADIAPAELERLAARVAELEPWEQGRFPSARTWWRARRAGTSGAGATSTGT